MITVTDRQRKAIVYIVARRKKGGRSREDFIDHFPEGLTLYGELIDLGLITVADDADMLWATKAGNKVIWTPRTTAKLWVSEGGLSKGRCPKKFNYTYNDIAKAKGITRASLAHAVTKKQVDANDLLSVARYITQGERIVKKVTVNKVIKRVPRRQKPLLKKRDWYKKFLKAINERYGCWPAKCRWRKQPKVIIKKEKPTVTFKANFNKRLLSKIKKEERTKI